MSSSITIKRIEVTFDRIVVLLQWPDTVSHETTPALIANLLVTYPDMPYHACVNGRGTTFEAVMESTPMPHLLEHLVLSEMTKEPSVPKEFLFCASSQWVDEVSGTARLEVAIYDDLLALRALKEALANLNQALGD